MSIGFIYAGQGAQHVGQGQDFYEKYQDFKRVIDLATETVSKVTEMNVAKLSFEGPAEQLSETRYTQPAMVAFAVGVTNLLHEAGIKADYSCGLSLGEYSALYQAGVFDEKQVLTLVSKRGKYMTEASAGLDVKMAAVLGLDRETVIECCNEATEKTGDGHIVEAANFNCPGQIVISGNAKAVDTASVFLKEAGAKRVLPLNVSGPFHTSIMKPAGDELKKALEEVEINEMNSKVIFNCLGREKLDSENVADLLVKQVQSSVYLEDSIRYMAEHGVDTIVEIGPGNNISKFVKKTTPEVRVLSIDNVEDFENAVKELLA